LRGINGGAWRRTRLRRRELSLQSIAARTGVVEHVHGGRLALEIPTKRCTAVGSFASCHIASSAHDRYSIATKRSFLSASIRTNVVTCDEVAVLIFKTDTYRSPSGAPRDANHDIGGFRPPVSSARRVRAGRSFHIV